MKTIFINCVIATVLLGCGSGGKTSRHSKSQYYGSFEDGGGSQDVVYEFPEETMAADAPKEASRSSTHSSGETVIFNPEEGSEKQKLIRRRQNPQISN